MFLDQDQMYLRMCNVNKEKILWKIYVVYSPTVTNTLTFPWKNTLVQFFN